MFINKCLCCNSENLIEVLDLGEQPPANSYRNNSNEILEKYPLGLNVCNDCWHLQLTFNVDRKSIFDEYHYASGTSKTLLNYFSWFAERLSMIIDEKSHVLEIAANDGSLIKELIKNGISCEGVDPAENIVKSAKSNNLPLIQGYWPEVKTELNKKYDVIVAMNVLAHVDEPLEFLIGCKEVLNKSGFILVQPSQGRMIENTEFDTCYHEHLSFFNTNSLSKLADRAGLKLYGGFFVRIHGDSPIYIIGNSDSPPNTQYIKEAFAQDDFYIDEDLYEYEKRNNYFNINAYREFSLKSEKIVNDLKDVIFDYSSQGYQIVYVGAAAKAMTILNLIDFNPDYFLDEAQLKIGKLPPKINTHIQNFDIVKKFTRKTLFIISAWNFSSEIVSKIKGLNNNSDFVYFQYFPKSKFI